MADVDLSPHVVAQVREAADILEVVGDHVRLRRAGRRWQGLCPFHEERAPSFSVDPERGLYYCFGCHAGGDVIDFVKRLEHLEFPEVIERLARRFGVQLPPRSPEFRKRLHKLEQQRGLLAKAQQWFSHQLASSEGVAARRELERRGFGADTVARFGFGFAPDSWRGLLQHLSSGATERAIIEAGLAVSPERGGRPYDRFRNRITFPINAADGRLIAFGGRIMGDGEPKYLNSPESPLFAKRSTLFNLDHARRAIGDSGSAVVVEGYFDCLSLARCGINNVVATLGTALTPDHARLLHRLAGQVLLCYDADAAGRKAAITGAEALLRSGSQVAMVTLPPGKDPDDLIRESGTQAFTLLLEQPTPLLEFLLADLPDERAERRRAGAKLARLLGAASDTVLRFSLLEELARRLDLPLEVIGEHARSQPGTRRQPVTATAVSSLPAGEALLALILVEADAPTRAQILESVDPELLQDPLLQRLFTLALEESQGTQAAASPFESWRDDEQLSTLIAGLTNRALPEIGPETIQRHLELILNEQRKEKARRLQPLIEEAEREGDLERLRQLNAEQMRLRRGS